MNRRRFLLTSLAGALVMPLAAGGQTTGKVWRIGWLGENPAANPHLREAFLQGLRDLSYVEGRNLGIEYRNSGGKLERFPALAAQLVALKVDVIFAAGGTRSALAAKEATRTVPIVFAAVADPVGSGLVTSLARPGGNATGLSNFTSELVPKCLGTAQAGRSGAQSGRCPLAARFPRRTHGHGHAEESRSCGARARASASIR